MSNLGPSATLHDRSRLPRPAADEQRNPRTERIRRGVDARNRRPLERGGCDRAGAVRAVGAELARAIDLVVDAFGRGGRLIYVAPNLRALGVLDASECPPTFGTPPDMVVGVIAGGYPRWSRAAKAPRTT